MDRKELVERRKHRRFPVKDLTFAVPRKNSDRIGKVVDIGMGGLAFHYSGAGEWSDKSLESFTISPAGDVVVFKARAGELPVISLKQKHPIGHLHTESDVLGMAWRKDGRELITVGSTWVR